VTNQERAESMIRAATLAAACGEGIGDTSPQGRQLAYLKRLQEEIQRELARLAEDNYED